MSTRSARAERRASKRRNTRILIIVIVILVIAAIAYIAYSGFINKKASTPNADNTTASGLKIEDLTVGTGQAAKAGDTISVHYTGYLADGTKFDSSLDRNQPYEFVLGTGNVIPGWDQGLVGMKVGGKRRLTIPPVLAYGAKGNGPIPPNATLTFEVELLDIK
jgi:FKBP-type peptidyl-prolyl cis-trans isomerase